MLAALKALHPLHASTIDAGYVLLADRHHPDRRVSIVRGRDAAEEIRWDLRGYVRHHMVLSPEAPISGSTAWEPQTGRTAADR